MKRPAPDNKKITAWKKYCDWLWARLIKARAGFKCEICGELHRADGKIRQIHAHHLIDREVLIYRHEPMNGICLCASCHNGDKHRAAHRNPKAFSVLFWSTGATSMAIMDRYFWWEQHWETGPDHDRLKPKIKDCGGTPGYPAIADRLEGQLKELAA